MTVRSVRAEPSPTRHGNGETRADVAVVVIGRNEGARLGATLARAGEHDGPVVYVDSRSTDGSVDLATALVDLVVTLDHGPLSAARARNEGAAAVRLRWPSVRCVQFVDGDCVLAPGWIERAAAALDAGTKIGAVCGWRVESNPTRNVFHRAANVEWRTGGVGDVEAFGGEAMIKLAAFDEAGGYRSDVIAGEDPELSARIRQNGWRIQRLDDVCSVHDIAMSGVVQWWRRAVRTGYGFSYVAGLDQRRGGVFTADVRRATLWGVAAPIGAVASTVASRSTWPLAVLAARYGLSGLRAARSMRAVGLPLGDRLAWGYSCSLSAVPAGVGVVRQRLDRLRDRRSAIIEYR